MSSGKLEFGPRLGYVISVADIPAAERFRADEALVEALTGLNVIFRALVGIMYNCVPTSGHPGGSISSSRIVESLLYQGLDYDMGNPEAPEADIISYAAGHKALGLYGLWALRNEIARISRAVALPGPERQMRLEDLLGFRRNPTQHTPLFAKFKTKSLDGHPAPSTPFVKLSTGASGVGDASSFGLALGAIDLYPDDPPRVHVIEGEGGMTPGRVQEAMATAASAQLGNIIMHIDWNQSAIDSDRVCREGDQAGDYVQWNPAELARLHDFNVIIVGDGFDYPDILAAQAYAQAHQNGQPTAIVYRTVKGWKYGIEGAASHGAGHKGNSEEFYGSLGEFEQTFGCRVPRFEGEPSDDNLEAYYWKLLLVLREQIEKNSSIFNRLGKGLAAAKERLSARKRRLRDGAPDISSLYDGTTFKPDKTPAELVTPAGEKNTLRGSLGSALGYLNKRTSGALIGAAADLYGSTSITKLGQGFDAGLFNAKSNPRSRLIAVGGICEDSMGAFMSALSVDGRHIGVGSSYGAFIAALQHVSLRLHGIGQQARKHYNGTPYSTYIMICAHAGLKTGEDGPTHADPQCLQLIQEDFPKGIMITLTPWDPNEIWPCLIAGLQKRPAILAPFVTRPSEKIIDRQALGLPEVSAAVKGIYAMRRADPEKKPYHGTLVLQGSGVTNAFVTDVLPKLDAAGINMNVYYVSSAELFDLLPEYEQESIFPEAHAREAMGITGFTLPTMYRWLTSRVGRRASLFPFAQGHYLGSGKAHKVLEEAQLDGTGQFEAIMSYAENFSATNGGKA
ncbi:MAG TPA: hypothetical protein VM425_13685 [Myxococcota bacterium]|nr:hypothetical protein [Myxococcota bacterium]